MDAWREGERAKGENDEGDTAVGRMGHMDRARAGTRG